MLLGAAVLKAIIGHSVYVGVGSAHGMAIPLLSLPLWVAAGVQAITAIIVFARFNNMRVALMVVVLLTESVLVFPLFIPIILYHGTEKFHFVIYCTSALLAVAGGALSFLKGGRR